MKVVDEPQFAKTDGKVYGSKRRGLLYEQRVTDRLAELDFVEGAAGVWFEFVDFHGHRYAQSDWIGFDWSTGQMFIVEVKLTRHPKAWWQLNRLYRPLAAKVFGAEKIACVEIATDMKNVLLPEDVMFIQDLREAKAGQTSLMVMDYE